MFIRVVKSNGFDGSLIETSGPDLQCSHTVLSSVTDAHGNEVARRVEIAERGVPVEQRVTIEIPRDGDVVYFMNDDGDTVNTIHWPPRESGNKRRKRNGRHQQAEARRAGRDGGDAGQRRKEVSPP